MSYFSLGSLLAISLSFMGCSDFSSGPGAVTVDGLFSASKGYNLGWKETGGESPSYRGDIDIKEFFFKSTNGVLCLFFKCSPSVQERYDKLGTSGVFAYLYSDSDSDTKTGATEVDESGNNGMLGTDTQIRVSIGVFAASGSSRGNQSGCSVSYEIRQWSLATKSFSIELRREDSTRGNWIAHGQDGVEIAIRLADLQRREIEQLDFLCLEWAHNKPEFANRLKLPLQ